MTISLENLQRLSSHARSYLSDIKIKSADINGGEASYYEGGKGETILLLHGFNSNKLQWRAFMGVLVERFHVIALDLPGFTFHSYRDHQAVFRIRTVVDYVKAFVDCLGIDDFHLMGHSAGSTVSASFAIKHGIMLKSLALMSMPAFFEDKNYKFNDIVWSIDTYIPQNMPDLENLITLLYHNPPTFPTSFKKRYLDNSIINYETRVSILQEVFRHTTYLVPRLRQLTMPTLCLYGEHDKITSSSSIEYLASMVPQLQTFCLMGSGHVPCIENHRESAAVYESFMKFQSGAKSHSG